MRRPFRKAQGRRRRDYLEMRLDHQARAIAAIAGRLDLVQRDADRALEALTEAESRIADLEARMFEQPRANGAVARWAPCSEAGRAGAVSLQLVRADGAQVEH